MEPLTLALIMGGSAAIKGIGQGISNYQQAQGMMSDAEKEQLKKLQRQQEMGTLGFTDQEMADMRQAIVNPVAALERQQADQLKATMAGMDSGAGQAFRMAMAQQDAVAQNRASIQDSIQAKQQAEVQRDEQMLLALANRESQQEAAKKAAITQAITMGIGGAAETGTKGMLLGEMMLPGEGDSAEAIERANALKTLGIMNQYLSGGMN